MEIRNILKIMENEEIVVMNRGSEVYKGTTNLLPFWLTNSLVERIYAVNGVVVLDVYIGQVFYGVGIEGIAND